MFAHFSPRMSRNFSHPLTALIFLAFPRKSFAFLRSQTVQPDVLSQSDSFGEPTGQLQGSRPDSLGVTDRTVWGNRPDTLGEADRIVLGSRPDSFREADRTVSGKLTGQSGETDRSVWGNRPDSFGVAGLTSRITEEQSHSFQR